MLVDAGGPAVRGEESPTSLFAATVAAIASPADDACEAVKQARQEQTRQRGPH